MGKRLRIGIDGTCLGSGRGYGRFLRELLPPLIAEGAHDYLLFVDALTASTAPLPDEIADMPVCQLRTRESQAAAASARGNRSVGDLLRMGRGVAAEALDVFYFPSVYSYFPIPSRVRVAVAIHDTIPERHGAMVFPNWRTRWLWNLKSRLARWQATTIVTVSEYARERISEEMGIPVERIFVTPEGPSPAFSVPADRAPLERWLAKHDLPPDAPYLLYVGGFNPHKNLIGLVRALARTSPPEGFRLILVGDYQGDVFHGNVEAIREEITLAGLADRVLWAGFVPDDDLRDLYAGAQALVLPSLEEGFGLPAVEAAACGTPCLATVESPLPDVLRGGGLFFDPTLDGALEACLKTLWADPERRKELGRIALERANALSWDVTARETRRALEATASLEPS